MPRFAEGFAYVGLDDRDMPVRNRSVYILASSPFALAQNATLHFDLHRRSNAITLQVCLNDIAYCPYEAPATRTSADWSRSEAVQLPADTKRVSESAKTKKAYSRLFSHFFFLVGIFCCNTVEAFQMARNR